MSQQATTISGMLQNLDAAYPNLVTATLVFCAVTATIILVKAIMGIVRLAQGQQRGTETTRNFIYSIIIAAILIQIATFLSAVTGTLYSSPAGNPFDYSQNLQEEATGNLSYVIHFVNFLGLIAVIRGLFMWHQIGEFGSNPNSKLSTGRANVLIIAGFFAMNVFLFVDTIANTLGWTALSTLIRT